MSDAAYFTEMEAKIPTGKVRTRFAPSPTGYMHIGNLRTALYTWLIARSHGGTFILRIEDTDQGRLVEGATDIIYRTMAECHLNHDEGPDIGGPVAPYIQSQRRDTYGKYARLLAEKGGAYYCFCEKCASEETPAILTAPMILAATCCWRTLCAAWRRASLTSSASASPRRVPPRSTMPFSAISPWKTAPWMTRYC